MHRSETSPESPRLWIVHRDDQARLALARLAGAGEESLLGAPGDDRFDTATPPDVVLLGVGAAPEAELEFAHAAGRRLADCGWILLAEPRALDATRHLFDLLAAEILPYPPTPSRLRHAIREAGARGGREPLSRRRSRELIRQRFGRWFAGLDLPSLLRASDPRLASVPLLVCGEPGTGSELVARYVHELSLGDSPTRGDAFLYVPCAEGDDAAALLARMTHAVPQSATTPGHWTLWLEDADRLAPSVQRLVRGWIEFGLPDGGPAPARSLRWVIGAGDPMPGISVGGIDPDLLQALSGLSVRLPALRERPVTIAPFAEETAQAWARARGERPRTFSDEARETLRTYPWPGNLRELEGVIERSLAASTEDPLRSEHLVFDSVPGPRRRSLAGQEPEVEPVRSAEGHTAGPANGLEQARLDERPSAAANVLGVRGTSMAAELLGPQGAPDDAALLASQGPPDDAELLASQGPPIVGELLDPSEAEAGAGLLDAHEVAELLGPLGPSDVAELLDPLGPSDSAEAREPAGRAGQPPADDAALRRLVGAVAHEVRNPLTSIRTFAELLPEHAGDAEFLERFSEHVGAGVRRIEGVVSRLQELSDETEPERNPVNIALMLEELLDERRDLIREHSLLVLRELDREQPEVLADEDQLRRALAGLLDQAFAWVPDRGDLYLATKHHDRGPRDAPTVRVLLRFGTFRDRAPRPEGVSEPENSTDLLVIENLIQAQGGSMTLDTTDATETVVVLDLPAP